MEIKTNISNNKNHLFLKMFPHQLKRDNCLCQSFSVGHSLPVHSDCLTFTAPAESIRNLIKNVSQASKPNYVRRKEVRICGQLVKLDHNIKYNSINWLAHQCLPSLLYITRMIWSPMVNKQSMQLTCLRSLYHLYHSYTSHLNAKAQPFTVQYIHPHYCIYSTHMHH